MKKIILGIFVFGFIFSFSLKVVDASLVDDLLNQIESLKTEIALLKSNQRGGVLGVAVDTTPRIMYWNGKVNQHIDENGVWQTDPDGKSGASIDKLTYCKKWYPNTIAVEPYITESIDTWRTGPNSLSYSGTKTSYKCVHMANTTPVINKISSNGTTPPILRVSRSYAIKQTQAIVGIEIISLGSSSSTTSPLYIYYGTTPHPTTSYVVHPNNLAVKTYEYKLTGLSCGTEYYFYGSIGDTYSPDGTFTTLPCDDYVNPNIPLISSPSVSSIGMDRAVFSGNISSPSSTVSEYGFCYKKGTESYQCVPFRESKIGNVTMNVYSLSPNTTYTYKLYAHNATDIGYSTEETFKTLDSNTTNNDEEVKEEGVNNTFVNVKISGICGFKLNNRMSINFPISSINIKLQTILSGLGYPLSIDGRFGRLTENVVKKFQADNNLDVDGKVGPITINALNTKWAEKCNSIDNKKVDIEKEIVKIDNPTLDESIICGYKLYTTMGFGFPSSSTNKKLQTMLNGLGYPINIDSRFGTVTQGVVMKFQADNNLYVDGVVGPNTIKVLNEKWAEKCNGVQVATPIHGKWSEWIDSGSCINGKKLQIRTCTNPAPSNGGIDCIGSSSQTIECISETENTENENSTACTISKFDVSKTTITRGESVEFTWETSNCGSLSLTSWGPVVGPSGSKFLIPTSTSSFTLIAKSKDGKSAISSDTKLIIVNR